MRIGPPHTSPKKSRAAPIAAKIGANDGPGMWMPAGVLRATGILPRRAFGWIRNLRIIHTIQARTMTMIAIGRSAMSEPQSGVTRSAVRSRNHCQMASIMGSGG